MKNILVPIGSSENCGNTLQYAIGFAKAFKAHVYVMQAYQVTTTAGVIKKMDAFMEQQSTERLKEVISRVDKRGVSLDIATYKGDVVSGVKALAKELSIDLIILEPRSNDIREERFLGHTTGSIIKQTDIPALVVPEGNRFAPYKSVLAAFRSGKLKNKSILLPLEVIKDKFNPKVRLLLVKTPDYEEEDLAIDPHLMDISSGVTITENATTFQGVLEHFQSNKPDLLAVFRRKRGFFTKLWEKNIILKREFHTSVPLLIMSVKK